MLSQGTIVSGYRVDGVLGEGGMGVVYRATQLSLNRTVALKILATELSDDSAFRERFRREGLLQAAIDHDHIVTVYEAGDTEHGLFLAMRLIRGPTLKDMILSGEVEPERALRILGQVAGALDTAHDVGLTHRDIKPQNILIGANDHAYLADFGLTQASDEASLTETGQFIGTIDYVAPEQIQGAGASARSDVYSLTAVLYEALTGEVPFARPNEAAALYAHIQDPPPSATERKPALPKEIDAVIARGMAKQPDERHGSAGELIADAQRAFGHEPATATRTSPQRPPAAATAPVTIPGGQQTVARGTAQPAAPAAATTLRGAPATSPANSPPTTADVAAAPPAAAPPAAAPPAARRRAFTPGAIALLAVLAIAAAAGGYLIGSGGDDGADAGGQELENSASAGTVGVSFPAGWRRVSESPEIPGMDLEDPVVLAPSGQGSARLAAGQVPARGPALLPAALVARLPGGAPDGEPVRLNRLEALRYEGLRPEGLEGRLDVFAVPTSAGVATVACTAPAGAAEVRRDCESIATTLQLAGARPYALGPVPAYARTLDRVFANLDEAARPAAQRLRNADTPDAQAAAARALERAYLPAATALARAQVSPADAAANAALAGALRATALAYRRAGDAAEAGDSAGYQAAQRGLRAAGTRLTRALAGLERLGYRVA